MAVAIVSSDLQRGPWSQSQDFEKERWGGGYIIDGYMMCSECL